MEASQQVKDRAVKTEENQYVTFQIVDEIYAVDVMRVQEVLYLPQITYVPHAMSFMKGMIDLRGIIVPVIDTRTKFKLKTKNYDADTVIIIAEFSNQLIGMIVDAVLDVLNISEEAIQDPAHFSNEIVDKDYIKGIARNDEKLVILLDIDRIFTKEELEKIGESA